MKQLAKILVFVILYLTYTNSEEIFKLKTLYAYNGKILMKNAASDNLASIWTISGKLSVENLTDYITFKLDDVKTRIFNGDPEILNSINEKSVPKNAEIIQEPFVVYPGDNSGYNISHNPNEEIWSLNMKRSIANIFFLNPDKKNGFISDERTIYGDCEVKYKISNDEGITIWKTINRKYCRNSPDVIVFNARSKYAESIKSETKRIYYFDDPESLRKVKSISFTTYQAMVSVRSKPMIEESQEFVQISNTTNFNPINIAKLTNTSSIIFDESTRKIEADNLNSNDLIKYFTENYEKFKEYFQRYPLMNTNAYANKSVSKMHDALALMDKDTLFQLEKKIKTIDDHFLQHLFFSYLPYLGTNDSLYYIKDLVTRDNKVLNNLLAIRILATFPAYNNDINTELMQELEVLMNLKKTVNKHVRDAGILSFASIVTMLRFELHGEEIAKYVEIYLKNFKEAKNYETKMVWLLGLINMGYVLKFEDICEIISNNNESRHIRVLAVYGFKESLFDEASPGLMDHYNKYLSQEHLFKNMWPIVKNTSEPFEVRVACLELLFTALRTKDEFKTIVDWYKDELLVNEEHLANYVYTSLNALENTSGKATFLANEAFEILRKMKPPPNRVWSTGNYRMVYIDKDLNFARFFQAILTSNPVTNMVNSALLTVENMAHSLDFGKYRAYIKAEGIAEFMFSKGMLNDDEEYTVPKLLELIHKNAYKFKETTDIHVDIVIFFNHMVVFNLHIDKYNIESFTTNPFYLELLSLITDYNSLSFPLFEYNNRVSDLGTPLYISADIVDIVSSKIQKDPKSLKDLWEASLKYRATSYYSLSMESLNPLLDASIETFKYIGEEKRIHIPYSFNFKSLTFQWKHENDAFNLVGDHLIGTMVDKEEVLHEYCANCDHVSLINNDKWKNNKMEKEVFWDVAGFTLNVTSTEISPEEIALNSMEPERTNSVLDIIDHFETRTLVDLAKPFLFLSYYKTYNTYIINDLRRYNIRSTPVYKDFPTESILEISFGAKDNSNDANPITNNDINIAIVLTTRKQSGAEILSQGNLTFRFYSASEFNSSDDKSLIHHLLYDAELYLFSDTESPRKMCLYRDEQYPINRKTDKFSLDPVDIAKAITTLSIGYDKNITSKCSTEDQIYVTEIFLASDKQKEMMLASKEYKKCKEQSKGLKYTPPTDDCLASQETISKYKSCDIYLKKIPFQKQEGLTEYGDHLLRYEQLNYTHSHLSLMSQKLLDRFKDKKTLNKVLDVLNFLPLTTLHPRLNYAYDDLDLEFGFSRACYITPDGIRTFSGHTIKNYDAKSAGDAVAFVECVNTTTAGMTIQKYGDKYVGFHLYSRNGTLVVSVPNADGKLRIEFNNQTITRTNQSDSENLFFLGDDAVFAKLDFADIYFTGEYISLKVYSIYNAHICGLCV